MEKWGRGEGWAAIGGLLPFHRARGVAADGGLRRALRSTSECQPPLEVLSCSCRQVDFLWRLLGASSPAEFFESQHAGAILQTRKYLVTSSAWLYVRHWHRAGRWPWRLATLIDPRRTYDERRQVADELVAGIAVGRPPDLPSRVRYKACFMDIRTRGCA